MKPRKLNEMPHRRLQCSLLSLQLLLPNYAYHKRTFLGLVTLTLTSQLDLDIFTPDLHAEIQACMSVCLARIMRRTDTHTHRQTHRQTMPKLLHPPLTRGVMMETPKSLYLPKLISSDHRFWPCYKSQKRLCVSRLGFIRWVPRKLLTTPMKVCYWLVNTCLCEGVIVPRIIVKWDPWTFTFLINNPEPR